MGKGRRVRRTRAVVPMAARDAGTAFGLGAAGRRTGGSPRRVVTMERRVEEPPDGDQGRRARERVNVWLEHLERLGTDRSAARRALADLDDEIAVAVARARVDGASWAEVGRALGISRQGARQVFAGAPRRRQDA